LKEPSSYSSFTVNCLLTPVLYLKEDELMNLIDIAIAYETSNETMYLRLYLRRINYNDLKPKENCQPSKLNH